MKITNRKSVSMLLAAAALVISSVSMAQSIPPEFKQIFPDQVQWAQSASLSHGGQGALIYGDPSKPGLFINRVKQPADFKILPHTHPEERVYTVISGTFYIGFGDTFDPDKLKAFPTGSVFVVPANVSHFHWMRSGEAVVQVSAMGPSGIKYVNSTDDPRRK